MTTTYEYDPRTREAHYVGARQVGNARFLGITDVGSIERIVWGPSPRMINVHLAGRIISEVVSFEDAEALAEEAGLTVRVDQADGLIHWRRA